MYVNTFRSIVLKAFMLFALVTFFSFANAQNKIHLIKILTFDDGEYVFRENAKVVSSRMDKEVADLSTKLGGYQIVNYELFNDKFNKNSILQEIENMSCTKDIVIVVYFGHGYRSQVNKTPYPDLYLQNFDNSVNFGVILEKLKLKKPSFILSSVTACQQSIFDFNQPIPYDFMIDDYKTFTAAPIVYDVRQTERYNDLFKRPEYKDYQTVSVEFIACSEGEFAYVDLAYNGGYFFEEFINAIQNGLVQKNKSTWTSIAEDVNKRTVARSQNEHKGIQHPFCLINLITADNKAIVTRVPEKGKPDDPVISNPNEVNKDVVDYYDPYPGTPTLTFAIRLTKLSNTYREAGQPDFAIKALNEALPVLESGDKYFEATAYENLGLAYLDKKDIENAKKNLKLAMEKFDKLSCCGSATTIRKRLIAAPFNMKPSELNISCTEKQKK